MTRRSVHSSLSEHFVEDGLSSLTDRPNQDTPENFNRARTLGSLSQVRKAKRVRFYRNGDRFHQGVTYAVSDTRFRTFDALLTDLTRALSDKSNLPFGVRSIFTIRNWSKVEDLNDLKHGESYVCSSSDNCKKMDYLQNSSPNWSKNRQGGFKSQSLTRLTSSRLSFGDISRLSNDRCSLKSDRDFIRPRFITVIRNGLKPRKAIRILLNKKTAHSLEQVANEITLAIKLDSGAVRKIYTLSGKEVKELSDFFRAEEVFIACGTEKLSLQDLEVNGWERHLIKSCETPHARRRSLKMKAITKEITTVPANKPHMKKPSKDKALQEKRIYPHKLLEKYEVLSNIGDGQYAMVKECVNRFTKQRLALKIVEQSKSAEKDHSIEDEIVILRKMNHPNIVQVVQDFSSGSGIFFIMELAQGGDLFDLITTGKKCSEQDISSMLHNIASALVYLHNRSIVHRDLKPENLLVFLYEDGTKALKLGDFGLATFLTGPLYTICGTPAYVAPEIVLQKGYGLEVDIWAAGIITYILLCGVPPFSSPTNNQEELFDLIIRGQPAFHSARCSSMSQSAQHLVKGMLQHDKTTRMNASQVLGHAWLSKDGTCDKKFADRAAKFKKC